MRFANGLALALCVAAIPVLGGRAAGIAPRHLYLEGSIPGADTVVTSLPEITLWFSQEPWPNTTDIELIDLASHTRVDVRAVHGYPDDPFTYSASLAAPLPPGRYMVSWRTRSDDGDPAPMIWDQIPFVVKAP